jgi:AsmA protein
MRKILLIVAAIVVAVPILAIGGFLLFFDADSFRPRLAEAVQRATGREFRIEGRLRLSPALTPTVSVDGMSLANIPGGSSPEMLRVAHAELRLGLIALIGGRIEIASLTLEGGRLLLEQQNWQMGRARVPAPATATPAPGAAPSKPLILDIRRATLKDWIVTYEGEEIRIPQARLTGTGVDGPLDLTATIVARGTEALVEGRVGAAMQFAAANPWPFRLSAVLPGGRISAEGQKTSGDWQAVLSADIPRLDALSAMAGRALPALTGINLRAQAALVGGAPQIGSIEGRIGGGEFAGITLTGATFTQASLQGAPQIDANGTYRGQPVTLHAEFVPMALQAGTPSPVTLRFGAAGASVSVYGSWPGELVVEANAPDLAALAPLVERPLPSLRDVTLRADVASVGDRFAGGVRIGGINFASSGGTLTGAVELGWAPRPSLKGGVTSARIDLAAFRAAPATPAPAPPAPAPPPAPVTPASGRLIPDIAIDITPLRLLDADLTFDQVELRNGEMVARQMSGHLVNQAGVIRLDPFAVTLPGGTLNLRIAADATANPPALQIAGGGQGLDPIALLGAFGITSPLAGRTDLDMDLRGQGATTRALAGTATGHLGLAVTEGRLSGRPAQTLAQIPGVGGDMALSCLALHAEADRGVATMRPLYLEGAPGRLGGEGTLNLRDETLSMRFNTDLRVAGVRLRAPVPLTGTLASPRLEMAGLAQGALSGELGDRLERAIPGLGGVLPQQSGAPSLPDCATALRTARGGRAGPSPAAAAQPQQPAQAPAAEQRQPALNNLLRGIFGR